MAASEVVASTVAAVGVPGVALVAAAWAGVEVEVAGPAVVVLALIRAVASKASMASVAGKGKVGFVEQTLAGQEGRWGFAVVALGDTVPVTKVVPIVPIVPIGKRNLERAGPAGQMVVPSWRLHSRNWHFLHLRRWTVVLVRDMSKRAVGDTAGLRPDAASAVKKVSGKWHLRVFAVGVLHQGTKTGLGKAVRAVAVPAVVGTALEVGY